MAKTSVEILGGKLDGTVINNMASEATMRDLLVAVKKMSGSTTGSSSSSGPAKSKSNLKKNLGTMSSLADGLGEQIGNVIGAVGGMGAMLAVGNTRMSSYTKALNDQVISKIPLVGGLLGGLGGVINSTIEVFEEWNESLKKGTDSGATFGNSILRASKAATSAAMGLDDYMAMVNKHSTTMLNLGGTVTEGAERFSRVAKQMNRQGGTATKTLRQMGYSAEMVNEAFLQYVEMTGMGLQQSGITDRQLAESFDTFQLNLIRMGYLTGQGVKKLEEQMAVASQDIVFRMQLAKLKDPKQRDKVMASLVQFTSMYGEAGAELFKAIFLGMPPGGEDARNLMVMIPELPGLMKKSLDSAVKGKASVDAYIQDNEDVLIDAMVASARRGEGIEGMLAAAGSGYADAEKLRKSLIPILTQLNKYGDIANIDRLKLKELFASARREAKDRDELTQFLNNMSMAFEELKFGLMDFFIPMLEDLGIYLEEKDLPGKVKEFGLFLKNSVEKYLPDVITFFKWLGDENGRSYILNEMGYFFKRMAVEFEYYAKEAFGFGTAEEYQALKNEELGKIKKDYEDQKTKLAPKLPERYVPPHKREGAAREEPAAPGARREQRPPSSGTMSTTGQGPLGIRDQTQYAADLERGGSLQNIQGTIIHHTGGRAMSGMYATLRNKGFSYNYAIDREGNIHQILPDGTVAYHAGKTPKMPHLSNQNTLGISLLANDDADILPVQLEKLVELQKFLAEKYGFTATSAFGHGETSAKQPTEGVTGAGHIRQTLSKAGVRSHKSGTLGQYGSLFKDFGAGTNVILDDVETVMTPSQMNSMIVGSGNIATTEMLQSLDRNFQRLVTIMSERTNISKSQLSYIEQNQTRIA